MPTPNGVNHLLQFLQFSLIPQLSNDKNQKWTFCLMSLMLRIEIAFAQQTSSKLGLYSLNRNFAICCYVTIRSYALKGETLISRAKIAIFSEIWKDVVRKLMLQCIFDCFLTV